MPLLSWLPLFKSKVEVEAKNKSRGNEILPQPTPASVDGTDFDNIADQVEALQSHLASAIDAHDEAILRAGLLKLEIADLEKVLESERKANGSLKRQLEAERKKTPPNVAAQIANDKALIKKHRAIISQQEARLAAQAATLTAQANLLSARTNHARELEERLIDIQFDLEYLQCTTKIERSFQSTTVREQDCPLVAQPFVVVLVDGDGYRWTPELLHNTVSSVSGPGQAHPVLPGSLAATRIRTEVIKYILDQHGAIPIESKIVTRIFRNFGPFGLDYHLRCQSKYGGILSREFAVQFTEHAPLFDYFDAGRGKERADDKLRENFHLYLSTPNCHAVFVAACLDNGFARMLEQYAYNPPAYQKIVLVSPGHIALEIERLNFKQVMWPSVFATETMPGNTALKIRRDLQRESAEKAHVRRRQSAFTGDISEDPDFPQLLRDMLPVWRLNDGMSRYSNSVGMRVSQASQNRGRDELTVSVFGRFERDDDID